MKGPYGKDLRAALAESDPGLAASKKIRTSVIEPEGNEFCQKPE